MARKKLFSIEELNNLSTEEINHKIIYENYSLLLTLGGDDMRREMVPVGKACKFAVNLFVDTTGPKNNPTQHAVNARKKLVKILSKVAPGKYEGFPKDSEKGLVVGFNHPSLGEIARILLMKIDVMGDKPMLFPVNLPWYEALSTFYDKIKLLGVTITPTITPSTWGKLGLEEDTELYKAAEKVKRKFRDMYTDLSHETIKDGGVIFVAPSATRQSTVFKSKAVYEKKKPVIPTLSILAMRLYKDPEMNCDFLPMGVLPPTGYKKGLNFLKTYELIPGEIMTAKEIRKKYFKTKEPKKLDGFDYDFHQRIAAVLPKDMWYNHK